MGRRPKITFKVKDCQTCSKYEEELDMRKELKGHPSERDMEWMLKLIKKDYEKK